jgi:hypothetical protein
MELLLSQVEVPFPVAVPITARLTAESWLVDLRQGKFSVRNRVPYIRAAGVCRCKPASREKGT